MFPLSNLDIEELCKSYNLTKYFVGVYSKDETIIVPKAKENNYFVIINLQDSDKGHGTHWVMYFKQGNKIFYFDSYGIEPYENLVKYCNDNNYDLFFNVERFQNDDWSCGYWCIKKVLEIVH